MSDEDIEGVVKTQAMGYKWGWDQFRIGWVQGTPRFSFQVAKTAPIHIPIEDVPRIQEIFDDLLEILDKHDAYN